MQYILSFENVIFVDFLAVKVNGSDVKPGICVTVNTRSYRHTENISLDFEPNRYYLMKINSLFTVRLYIKTPWSYETDSWFDVTSVNFNSQKVHEDKIFERQDILQFLSQGSKYYKYVKYPTTLIAILTAWKKFLEISHRKGSTRVKNDVMGLPAHDVTVIIFATFKMCYEYFHSTKLLHSAYLSQIF